MLVKEPFNMSMEEVSSLTPYQVRNIFFRPEKKKGSEVIDEYTKQKDLFWKVQKEWRGKTEEETRKLWQEHVSKSPNLKRMGLPFGDVTEVPKTPK